MVLLYLLNKFYKNTNVKISVIFIDEELKILPLPKKVIKTFVKKNPIFSYIPQKEYGITTEIAKIYDKNWNNLHIVILRRKALNKLFKKSNFQNSNSTQFR